MRHQGLPPLRKLFDVWSEQDQFHYLKKFLTETRRPFGPSEPCSRAKASRFSEYLDKVFDCVGSLTGFIWLLIRSFATRKGLPAIFNHTSRIRQNGGERSSLYLSRILKHEKAVVFEDSVTANDFHADVLQFHARYVARTSQIISAILVRLYGRKKVADRDIATFVVARTCWRLVFRLLKPSCVRVFVWYGKEAIVCAAKSLDIEVADVQHGIIYSTHPFYAIGADTPSGADYLLPDKFLVYGQYWKSLLIRSGWPEDKIVVVGYFIDFEQKNNNPLPKPYILYTSQPHTSQVIRTHIKSIEADIKKHGYSVMIAKHPSEMPGLYDDVISETVKEAVGIDSYDLLRQCAVHISISSTLLWEAIAFGKPSYILDFGREAVDLLSDYLTLGYGRTLQVNEFPYEFKMPTQVNSDYFFSDNIKKEQLLGVATADC